ncbi:hypothetical protein AOQ84DRAFT_425923 [Glonium stellatum]|uniref:Protein SERAC1 n=1 Tax=Glonium stellatum TaxID=574774 RepID=A0A8E2EP30_9PEZI|nr:hypothetical protein AOQ84DRAFT_425923 [Glonium stellatum]
MQRIPDIGISVAYEPENCSPIVDIIIIHGLQGHPYKTWAYTKVLKPPTSPAPSRPEASEDGKDRNKSLLRRVAPRLTKKSSEKVVLKAKTGPALAKPAKSSSGKFKSVFWPADLLPRECPNSRILVYGYDTKITKYMNCATNKNSVFSHSKDLLFALCRERMLDRPLIFIAHSLGGIVVKEMLARSSASTETELKNVVDSTAAVIFLGTPHRGSPDLAALGEWVRSVVSTLRMGTTSAILDALSLKTSDLERAQEEFSGLWQKYGFRVKTFQEGLGLAGVNLGVLGNKVVPDYSSLIGDQREHAETIEANHMGMCRFSGADDPNYHKVAGELRSIYLSIERLNVQKVHQSGRIQRRASMRSAASSVKILDKTNGDKLDEAEKFSSAGSHFSELGGKLSIMI